MGGRKSLKPAGVVYRCVVLLEDNPTREAAATSRPGFWSRPGKAPGSRADFAIYWALLFANGDHQGIAGPEALASPFPRSRFPRGSLESTKKTVTAASASSLAEKSILRILPPLSCSSKDDSVGADAILKETASWLSCPPSKLRKANAPLKA